MTCDRCGRGSINFTMSWFNEEMICTACSNKEKERPDYKEARAAEHAAVVAGDRNFPGIGL